MYDNKAKLLLANFLCYPVPTYFLLMLVVFKWRICVQKPLGLLECWGTGSIQERDLIQGTWYTPSTVKS